MEATISGTKRSRSKDASRVSEDAHDDGGVLDDEGKSGVKEIVEVHEEIMHTPDEPEEPKFDDAFETGESSSRPASDFKDRAEDEDEDEWTHSEMEEYEDFLKRMDDAVPKKSEAIRARRREKGKGKPKVKQTSKEKGVDFSEAAKTCEYPAYAAVPTGDHDEKLSKTETHEGDFIEALRGMLKPMTDEMKNLEKKVNTLSLVGPSGSIRPPADSPIVPRSVKAFKRLKESRNENMGLTEWSDDDHEDKTKSSMKMEMPAFEGKDVERFSVTFARYFLLTGKHQCKDKVKAALLIEGSKKPDVKLRAENCLKRAKSLEDFFNRLQRLYPEIETDLSRIGQLAKIGHLPADPKPAQIENLLNELDKVFEKFTPNALFDQQKLLELASKVNDKTFMKWAEDPNLSPYLHDYDTLSILRQQRATFSVSLKHLQDSRGHGGRTATLRRMEKEKSEKGVPGYGQVGYDRSLRSTGAGAVDQRFSLGKDCRQT